MVKLMKERRGVLLGNQGVNVRVKMCKRKILTNNNIVYNPFAFQLISMTIDDGAFIDIDSQNSAV